MVFLLADNPKTCGSVGGTELRTFSQLPSAAAPQRHTAGQGRCQLGTAPDDTDPSSHFRVWQTETQGEVS